MMLMEPEVLIVRVSLKKVVDKFKHWLTMAMDQSGLPLYLILYYEEIEVLSGAEPIGLEVNLPSGMNVYMGRDRYDRGRRKPRIDLIFKKGEDYYLVEVIDKKHIPSKEKDRVREYARAFKENLGLTAKIQVVPIIVCPIEDFPTL